MKQELELKTRRSILRARKIGLLLRGRNSGQALVEYILLVSISIAIIFIIKGAFSGMSNFIDNYLGKYTECLMAHGELPALGVTEADLKKHLSSDFKCESGFKPFTLAEGRPPIASGNASGQNGKNSNGKGGGGSGSESSSGSSSNSNDSSSKDGKNGDKDAMSRNGSGSGTDPYGEGKIRRNGRGTADGIASGGNNNQRLIEDEEGDEAGGRGRKRKPRESRIIYRDRPRYRAILGDEAEQLTKLSSRSSISRKPTARTIAKVEGGTAPGPRSGLVRPPPEKAKYVEETKDEGWGFGKIIKWLFIIAIIVALVIFFGGQLLGYSNSDSS